MTARLIGDVGATGSDWILVLDATMKTFTLGGYNPLSQSVERMDSLLNGLRNEVGRTPVNIHFYGAGVGIGSHLEMMEKRFKESLSVRTIEFASDLLGAAWVLCGTEVGVVCILGIGSNVCYYDGHRLQSGHSLGYLIGDEGSGMDIGRRLIRAYYYELLPARLKQYFSTFLPKDRLDFLRKFKDQTAPNQFLAQFTEYVLSVKDQLFIQEMLSEAFTDFIIFHLYHIKRKSKINVVGSIAFYFCGEFEKCLSKHDLQLGKVLRKPIDALAAFHNSPNNKL